MLTGPSLPRAAAQQPAASLTIAVAGASVVEGNTGDETDLDFTVTLSGSPSHDVRVRVSTLIRGGTSTARANRDFRAFTGTPLVFAAGASGAALTKTVTVVVLGDTVDEDDETVILRVNNLQTDDTRVALVGGAKRLEATGVIIDDDGGDPVRHLISVASDMSVVEGDTGSTAMNFTVTLGASPSHRVEIQTAAWNPPAAEKDPGIAKGGFSAGQDFHHFKYRTVVWDANASGAALTKTITVTVLGDEVDEGDKETLILRLNILRTDDPRVHFPGGATLTEALGTIIDDDSSPVLSEIADRTILLGEAVDITAVATDADSDTLNYFWSRAANESALPPGTALGQARLAFTPPAIGVYTMTVRASDGHGNEDTEDVVVTVVRPPSPGVTVTPAALTVMEGGAGSYTVVLDTQPSAEVTIAVGGAARDVTVEPSRLAYTTSNWSRPQTVTVSAAHDDDASADADVTLVHAASGGGYDGVSIDSVVVTVTEDDTPGVTVTPTALTVMEGGAGSYTVVLDTQPSAEVTIAVGGVAGDVTVEPSRLAYTTSNWSRPQTVTVSAAHDDDASADADVTLVHAASGGGYDGVSIDSVVVTVTEDDTPGVTVAPTVLTVMEGGVGSYTVELDTQPSAEVTIAVGGVAGDVTVEPSRLAYTTSNWSRPQTVTVSAAHDDDASADADVTLVHAASGGGYDGVSIDSVVVTVTEDDTPGVTVTPTALTVMEGGAGSYTVVLDTQPSAEVTIAVGGAAGDVTVEPSRLAYTTSNWSAPQTVTVSAAHDDDASADADVTLVHAASGGGYDGVSIDSVEVTVTEDDTPGVTVTPTALTVMEGGAGSYTVVLDTQPSAAVEVAVSGASGDASVEPVSLVFTASTWNEAQSVTVSAAEDADAEPDAPVVLTHAASGGDYDAVTVAAVTVTLAENDTQEQVDTRRIDRINEAVLPHVIGALESTNPVKERIEAAAAGAAAGAPGDRGSFTAPGASRRGDPLRPAPWGRPERGLPGGTAGFALPLGAAGAGDGAAPSAWLWGGGKDVSFSGSEREASWTGRLSSVYLGTDVRLRRNVVVGAVVSHAMSRVDVLAEDVDRVGFEGVHETGLTKVYPYAAWFLEDGSNLWASLGVGAGNVRVDLDEIEPGGAATRRTDLTVASTAVGGRRFLASNPEVIAGGMTRIAVKGQGSLLRARTAAEDGLAALAVDAARLRLALEGSHERPLAGGATLTPAVEAGFRYDGGDISEGAGFEFGASLTWRRPDRGLTMKLRGRTLAAHQKDRDETAVGALLLFDRKADGRGTYLSLAPSWGAADTGMAQMFDESPMPNGPMPNGAAAGSADPMAARMDAELGYGIGVVRWGPAAVLRPYTRLSLGQRGDGAFVLGAEYVFGSVASVGVRLGRLQGLQSEPAHSFMLRGTARW